MLAKTKNIWQKAKFKFHNSLSNLHVVEILLGNMHDFWEWIWSVFSEEMSFEIFSPILSYVNEKDKKNRKLEAQGPWRSAWSLAS